MDHDMAKAEKAGMKAAAQGLSMAHNPYTQWVGVASNEAWAWALGWRLGKHMKGLAGK